MKRLWVGTGWKMNHLMEESLSYAARLREFVDEEKPDVNVFICVPFTVLHAVSELLTGSEVNLASQNVHWLDRGAATGEISPVMVKDAGANMVEIGHSERRQFFGENNVDVNKKMKAAFSHHLRPILCIGETSQDKAYGVGKETLDIQLKIALHGLTPEQISQTLVAYEPVWAIGDSGKPAAPEYVNEIHAHLSSTLCKIAGETHGKQVPIIYGGSVNPENASSLISQPNVDGLFIGRSAWQVEGFINLIQIVESHTEK